MNCRRYCLALFAVLFFLPLVGSAYGHGLGQDQALPVTVGDKQVTVMAEISPAAVPLDPSARPSLLVRVHDENTNATIAGIDYRLNVEHRGLILLDQRFRSADGIVLADLIPDGSIEGWEITGHESVTPEEQVNVDMGSPIELRSKILASGGLYHLTVVLESTSQGISLDQDIEFDLYISIAHSASFTAQTAAGPSEITVKSYYDDVEEFSFQNGTLSFSMPFDWDAGYVAQVPFVHMEVQFPKALEELKTNSYVGTLNGVVLPSTAIQIDDYSSIEDRTVHFVIPNSGLFDVSEEFDDQPASAIFALTGAERPKFPMDLLSSPTEKYLLQLAWGPDVIETGIPITFVMNIQDPATGDLIRRPFFDFVVAQDGAEIYRQRLQSDLGTFAHTYTFQRAGTVTFSASNINGEGESVGMDLVVLQGVGAPPPSGEVPPEQPSGCLIATAAFGSELSPQVQYLRNFRENYILSTAAGSAFMSTFNAAYYSFSPQVADYEREQPWLQTAVRAGLYPLFGILMVSEKTHFVAGGGEFGAVASGAVASMLIGATYLSPAGFASARRVPAIWIAVSAAAAGGLLLVSIVAFPVLLPSATAAFVLALAASSALCVGMLVRRVLAMRRQS